jgi:hypothetical protein
MSNDLHAVRKTARLGIETPLLVPSFSSRGFPGIGEFIEALRPDIGDLCLVSAFDVVNGRVPQSFETLADIVLLDSGLYESSSTAVAVDTHLPHPGWEDWTRTDYRRFLSEVAARLPMTNAIVVSYDTYAPLAAQVEAAHDDFSVLSGVALDFLIKPERQGDTLGDLNPRVPDLAQFDVLGVTERELGRSALARCRALLRLRRALNTASLEIPLHVFGSITPAAVTAYFLCGADVFDGLNWLRVSLDQLWAGAPSEFAVAHGLGHLDDREVELRLWRQNLGALRQTQAALRRFAADGDTEELTRRLPFARASFDLARAAYAAEGM